MLIEFSVSNFRSMKDKQVLRMTASPATEWQSTHTFESGQPSLPRILRSAAIYGPNAAGKTNLLKALQFMQAFVIGSANLQEGNQIFVRPFILDDTATKKTSEFEIHIVEEDIRYQYGFAVDQTRVHREWLIAFPNGRPQKWLEREYSIKEKDYKWFTGNKLKGDSKIWKNATRTNALFLSTAIQLNSEQLRPVFNWFQQRLSVVAGSVELNRTLTVQGLENPEHKKSLLNFLSAADLSIEDIEIKRDKLPPGFIVPNPPIVGQAQAGVSELISLQTRHKAIGSAKFVMLALAEESAGTIKMVNLAGAWLKVLRNSEVLFIDELDNSLHPALVRFLVGAFHDATANKSNAQLIFSTHETTLLDSELMRRDQIWFIEKDRQQSSHLYSLLEYSPRKTEAISKGYLKGRYGALPFVGDPKF